MYFIDTNIFMEYLFERNRWKECEALFKRIEKGEITAFTSSFCIHSIELFMINSNKKAKLKQFLEYLASLDKLFICHTTLVDDIQIVCLFEKGKLDFEDTIQFFVAKYFKCKAIISFDRHFDNLEIPRKNPEEITK